MRALYLPSPESFGPKPCLRSEACPPPCQVHIHPVKTISPLSPLPNPRRGLVLQDLSAMRPAAERATYLRHSLSKFRRALRLRPGFDRAVYNLGERLPCWDRRSPWDRSCSVPSFLVLLLGLEERMGVSGGGNEGEANKRNLPARPASRRVGCGSRPACPRVELQMPAQLVVLVPGNAALMLAVITAAMLFMLCACRLPNRAPRLGRATTLPLLCRHRAVLTRMLDAGVPASQPRGSRGGGRRGAARRRRSARHAPGGDGRRRAGCLGASHPGDIRARGPVHSAGLRHASGQAGVCRQPGGRAAPATAAAPAERAVAGGAPRHRGHTPGRVGELLVWG